MRAIGSLMEDLFEHTATAGSLTQSVIAAVDESRTAAGSAKRTTNAAANRAQSQVHPQRPA